MDNLSKNGIPDVTKSQIETMLKIEKVYFILFFNSFCGITFWKNTRRCLLRGHQHGKNFQFCKKPLNHYIHQKVACQVSVSFACIGCKMVAEGYPTITYNPMIYYFLLDFENGNNFFAKQETRENTVFVP